METRRALWMLLLLNVVITRNMESIIKWQKGTPKIGGEYLVCLKNGSVITDKFLIVDGLEADWERFNKSYITAWCKLSDIEPYKEETK